MGVLDGKVAIITGGGGGIGRGLCLALAREGAAVAVVDISEPAARRSVEAVEEIGGKALALATDIRQGDQVRAAVERVVGEWGTVDILINNAQGGPHETSLEDHTDADFAEALATGPMATWYFMSACLPHLKGGGRVVNFRSASEFQGLPGHGAYVTAKGAIAALTKSAAREWGRHDITVNCISPFVMHSAAIEHFENHPEQYNALLNKLSIPRSGEAESDTGRAAVYLCGPDASYITACTLTVDGGGTFL